MGPEELRRAIAGTSAYLGAVADRDWQTPLPHLELDVASTVAHVAEVCLWYAIDLSARGADLEPVDHRVEPDSAPADLIRTLTTYGEILLLVVEAAPPEARGFHPYGLADASGFAAMACDELLVHTDDVARALEEPFHPEPGLAAAVLERIFPWAPTGGDPWDSLLWANGRTELLGRGRLQDWRWHCAPLSEWDGERPAGVEA
jgi:Mycothiol maleylpyruvate isomerase N-terminal domain